MIVSNPRGSFKFLRGGVPFSGAVVADAGYGIVHATFLQPSAVAEGVDFIAAHLQQQGRPVHALCSLELRSPRRLNTTDFAEFNNKTYLPALQKHDLMVEGVSPITRSNVAAEINPPATQVVYAFAYTVPTETRNTIPEFVLSGAADSSSSGIVRAGETSDDAMREKATHVMRELQERLDVLDLKWDDCSAVNVYTAQNIFSFLREALLEPLGRAQLQGVRWYLTRPPIEGMEFEVDARRTLREIVIS